MSEYFKGEEQSVQDILEARDMRVRHQEYLLDKYKTTVVSYKMNIPGPVKYSPLIKQIFDEGLSVLKQELANRSEGILYDEVWYRKSGPEYFAVCIDPAMAIKLITSFIEESHALGRLYDFDVLNTDGTQVSRKELGFGERKCMLCDNSAFQCGRSRKHAVSELTAHIKTLALNYFRLKEDI